ncbi:hypothetical protein F5882DRAFT_407756 [Hyaloscypha sp. PMI_1271]|nr:hypothetical protein F5882DRAFT_407756 [Hyaloscypha sp. PMI_1271]
MPLVIYLASYKSSHTLVGKTSLTGRLCIGLFSKLGVLGKVASLLKEGSDDLDSACSISELKKDVWDANFGSKFPCANSAASALITSYATRGKIPISVESTIPSSGPTSEPTNPTAGQQPQFRRYQTLHLLQLSRGAPPRTLVFVRSSPSVTGQSVCSLIRGIQDCSSSNPVKERELISGQNS